MLTEFDRVLGSLYGMATGDALGVPSSFMTPNYIAKTWGWIDTFYPPEKGHIFHDGLNAGEYTDDTEQALAIIESYVRKKQVDPYDIVNEILKWAERVKDKYASPLGPSTERALKNIKAGKDIKESGKYSNTNGSAMRISPIGIIHGLKGTSLDDAMEDIYLTCMPTHNTSVCVSSAAAIAWGVALCIRGDSMENILKGTIEAAKIGTDYGFQIVSPSIPKRIEIAYDIVKSSKDYKDGMFKLYEMFGGGDIAADSIPLALGIFLLGDANPKKVNEIAVNIGGDCDTNAAMAGAMAGAYTGISAIPQDWIDTINKVNNINLETHAKKLIELIPEWKTSKKENRSF